MANSAWSVLVGVELDTDTRKLQAQLDKAAKGVNLSFQTHKSKDWKNLIEQGEKASLTFQAANLIFSRSVEVITSMVEEVYNLNGALIEFQKVSDLSGEGLNDYVDKLTELGQEVARTSSEMVEAATEFRKNSFNDEDSAQLARVSAMFANVADEATSASDSASFIIAQMIAFGIEADNAEHIIDAVDLLAA